MNKDLTPYPEAAELKALGFDEPCLVGYDISTEKLEYYSRPLVTKDSFTVDAPTYSQVFRWFEENYSYFVDIKTDTTPNEILGFDYTISSWKFPPMYFDFFNDKREGNIAVIKKMIEMVKKEKQKAALIELMNMDNDNLNNLNNDTETTRRD